MWNRKLIRHLTSIVVLTLLFCSLIFYFVYDELDSFSDLEKRLCIGLCLPIIIPSIIESVRYSVKLHRIKESFGEAADSIWEEGAKCFYKMHFFLNDSIVTFTGPRRIFYEDIVCAVTERRYARNCGSCCYYYLRLELKNKSKVKKSKVKFQMNYWELSPAVDILKKYNENIVIKNEIGS